MMEISAPPCPARLFCSQRQKYRLVRADYPEAAEPLRRPFDPSTGAVSRNLSADGETTLVGDARRPAVLFSNGPAAHLIIAYDDIAFINYFGDLCKPWYRRDGRQITDAIRCVQEHLTRS